MVSRTAPLLVLLLVLTTTWSTALVHESEGRGALPVVSELASRVAGLAGAGGPEPRLPLPLPSAQEVAAIKKVADILVMLGEQVIPTIMGETTTSGGPQTDQDIANDDVDTNN